MVKRSPTDATDRAKKSGQYFKYETLKARCLEM